MSLTVSAQDLNEVGKIGPWSLLQGTVIMCWLSAPVLHKGSVLNICLFSTEAGHQQQQHRHLE